MSAGDRCLGSTHVLIGSGSVLDGDAVQHGPALRRTSHVARRGTVLVAQPGAARSILRPRPLLRRPAPSPLVPRRPSSPIDQHMSVAPGAATSTDALIDEHRACTASAPRSRSTQGSVGDGPRTLVARSADHPTSGSADLSPGRPSCQRPPRADRVTAAPASSAASTRRPRRRRAAPGPATDRPHRPAAVRTLSVDRRTGGSTAPGPGHEPVRQPVAQPEQPVPPGRRADEREHRPPRSRAIARSSRSGFTTDGRPTASSSGRSVIESV